MTEKEVQDLTNFVKVRQKRISQLTDPSTFVLNTEVIQLQKEIDEVLAHCPHNMNNGKCTICNYKKEV